MANPLATMKVFIDLFSGLGGASSAFLGTDWKVIRIDNNPDIVEAVPGTWLLNMNYPSNVLDIIANHLYDQNVTRMVVWASPPCTDFSGVNLEAPAEPSTRLLNQSIWLIEQLSGMYNVTEYFIENVKGAVNIFNDELGHYRQRIGPFFLWGRFAPIACIDESVHRHRKPFNKTNSRTPLRSNIHAEIPYALSESVRDGLNSQLSLMRWV